MTAGAMPVPVSGTTCAVPLALSLTLMSAVRVPVAAGVKVALMVQKAPAAREEGQVLVWE